MLPSWNSIQELQDFSGKLRVVLLLAGAITLAAGVWQYFVDRRRNDLQAAESADKDAKHSQLLESVRKRLSPRSEMLTDAVRASIIDELRGKPSAKCGVTANIAGASQEPHEFAKALFFVLLRANWPMKQQSEDQVHAWTDHPAQFNEITLVYPDTDASMPAGIEALAAVLRKHGFVVDIGQSKIPFIPKGEWLIVIGPMDRRAIPAP